MTKPRKTTKVADVVAKVNHMIEHSPNGSASERRALCILVEHVLLEADAYAGFRYHASTDDVKAGNYDDTRRTYYILEAIR